MKIIEIEYMQFLSLIIFIICVMAIAVYGLFVSWIITIVSLHILIISFFGLSLFDFTENDTYGSISFILTKLSKCVLKSKIHKLTCETYLKDYYYEFKSTFDSKCKIKITMKVLEISYTFITIFVHIGILEIKRKVKNSKDLKRL
ncbi:MAG: hypothetical protein JKY89_12240 [Immundisolibacteraceae bacterium]|nr:hypothetical protein [Immundisolibacteraceae bacterium]